MSALSNGVHSLPREQYDRLDRVNFSTLKLLAKSPAHYRHQVLSPQSGDTDAKKLGRAIHLAVFEPEKFRATCVVWSDRRAGKDWEHFLDKHPDDEILTESMYEKAVAIGQAARSSAKAAPYLAGGQGEQSVLWSHVAPELGGLPGFEVTCKGRVDFLANAGPIVDLKSTRDASPMGFGREAARYSYHVQAPWYVDGVKAATGIERDYVIVAVESAAPYVVEVYRLTAEQLAIGRDVYREWLQRLDFCRRESEWPGYATEAMDLVLPRWAVPEDDESAEGLGLDLVLDS